MNDFVSEAPRTRAPCKFLLHRKRRAKKLSKNTWENCKNWGCDQRLLVETTKVAVFPCVFNTFSGLSFSKLQKLAWRSGFGGIRPRVGGLVTTSPILIVLPRDFNDFPKFLLFYEGFFDSMFGSCLRCDKKLHGARVSRASGPKLFFTMVFDNFEIG